MVSNLKGFMKNKVFNQSLRPSHYGPEVHLLCPGFSSYLTGPLYHFDTVCREYPEDGVDETSRDEVPHRTLCIR